MEEVFPFSEVTRIEAVSFQYKMDVEAWYEDDSIPSFGYIIPKNIDTRVTLTQKQARQLFTILYEYEDGEVMNEAMMCYNPHHSIFFYKGDSIIAYFEVCISCHQERSSRNLHPYSYCNDVWYILGDYFDKIGLKTNYYEDKEEKSFREKYCECVANSYVELMDTYTPPIDSRTIVAYGVAAYNQCDNPRDRR